MWDVITTTVKNSWNQKRVISCILHRTNYSNPIGIKQNIIKAELDRSRLFTFWAKLILYSLTTIDRRFDIQGLDLTAQLDLGLSQHRIGRSCGPPGSPQRPQILLYEAGAPHLLPSQVCRLWLLPPALRSGAERSGNKEDRRWIGAPSISLRRRSGAPPGPPWWRRLRQPRRGDRAPWRRRVVADFQVRPELRQGSWSISATAVTPKRDPTHVKATGKGRCRAGTNSCRPPGNCHSMYLSESSILAATQLHKLPIQCVSTSSPQARQPSNLHLLQYKAQAVGRSSIRERPAEHAKMTNRSRRGEPGLQRYESTWIRGIEREELRRGRLGTEIRWHAYGMSPMNSAVTCTPGRWIENE
jgi:hypothetical protein